jgi:cadmium resistance protein CadD (predicted permease)
MFALITAIPALISGLFGTVNGITKAIADEKIAGINATTEQERIHSAERVQTLQSRRDLMIAEAGVSKLNIIVRSTMGLSVAIVLFKLLVWDKVIGSLVGCSQALKGTCGKFTTDPFDDNQWKIIMIVVGFYFLYEGATAVTRMVKTK